MRMNKEEKRRNTWTLALGVALLPPIWAVLAPHLGVTTGAVALICAGVYAANGNKYEDCLKITLGFLCGDIWAVAALFLIDRLPLPADLATFLTLFVMGGLAVLISTALERAVYLPAWLCGWAVGLTIMGPAGWGSLGSLPVQIGAAMAAGVVYVGAGVDLFQKKLLARRGQRKE